MPVQYYNGQLYDMPSASNMIGSYAGIAGHPLATWVDKGWIKPIQIQAQQPAAPAPMPAPKTNQLQPQFNKLTGQARDALYGGLLGYQSPSLTSGGSNPQSFAAPQGGFRFPFGLLNQG